MHLKHLSSQKLSLLAEIDRAEHVHARYSVLQGNLVSKKDKIEVPSWHTKGDGDHSVANIIQFAEKHVSAGALAIGAFSDDNSIAGMGIIRCNIEPGTAQIALLYVDRSCRRTGVATALMKSMESIAVQSSASNLYVSATPTDSAVNLYLSWGFQVTQKPIQSLYELEPDDIHMIKVI